MEVRDWKLEGRHSIRFDPTPPPSPTTITITITIAAVMSTLAFLYAPVSHHQRRNGNGYELPSLAGGLSLFPFLQQPKGSFLSSSPPNLSIAIPSKSASEPTSNSGLPTSSSSPSSPLPSLELEQGPQRYAAYAMRLKTLIVTSSRYIAYSSDIGEAFRPLTRPEVVRAAYGISWLYLISDVAYAGYKAANAHETAANEHGIATAIQEKAHLSPPEIGKQEGADPSKHSETSHVGFIMARRAVFQSLASMALRK